VPVSDAAARRAADWLAAWARAGLLGSDPEVVGFVADLIQFVGERTMDDEQGRLREALAWAVGFIRCNLPKTSAGYPDMRNAEDLVSGTGLSGEFHRTCCRAEVAEDRARELEAEVARLREGLRPFADAGIPDNWPAECVLTWDAHDEPHDTAFVNYLPLRVGGGPTVGDYRRAAALLGDSQ